MATKKSPAKKAPAKKSAKGKKRSDSYVSFKLQPNERPFIQFELSRQTAYWTLISILILSLGLYVIYLQSEVSYIYDQVNTSALESDVEVKPTTKQD